MATCRNNLAIVLPICINLTHPLSKEERGILPCLLFRLPFGLAKDFQDLITCVASRATVELMASRHCAQYLLHEGTDSRENHWTLRLPGNSGWKKCFFEVHYGVPVPTVLKKSHKPNGLYMILFFRCVFLDLPFCRWRTLSTVDEENMNGQDPFVERYITHLNGGFLKWYPKPVGFNTTKVYKGLSWASHKPGWGAQRRWHLQQDDWNSCDKSRRWQRKSDLMGYRGMLKWDIYIYIHIQ